jgi:hypothetical protein
MLDEQDKSPDDTAFFFGRLLDEVYLLIDFVSSRPDKDLNLIERPANSGQAGKYVDLKESLERIVYLKLQDPSTRITPENTAFLLLLKNSLTRAAYPATRTSIVFTALVTSCDDRRRLKDTESDGYPGGDGFACIAYPKMRRCAQHFRHYMRWAPILLFILAIVTIGMSGITGYGHSLIARLDNATKDQTRVFDIIRNIESTAVATPGTPTPPISATANTFLPYCDRITFVTRAATTGDTGTERIRVYESSQHANICGQLREAEMGIWRARDRIDQYLTRFSTPLIPVITFPARVLEWIFPPEKTPSLCAEGRCDNRAEWSAEDYVSALSTQVLPLCFTMLGVGVSLLRDYTSRIKDRLLNPTDMMMSFARLALGVVAGLAIGLFNQPADTARGGTAAIINLSLSAQGLAFLAGYAMDSVFAFFDAQIRRLNKPAEIPQVPPKS